MKVGCSGCILCTTFVQEKGRRVPGTHRTEGTRHARCSRSRDVRCQTKPTIMSVRREEPGRAVRVRISDEEGGNPRRRETAARAVRDMWRIADPGIKKLSWPDNPELRRAMQECERNSFSSHATLPAKKSAVFGIIRCAAIYPSDPEQINPRPLFLTSVQRRFNSLTVSSSGASAGTPGKLRGVAR